MKKTYLLTILLLSLFTTNMVYAYPPDNAAVIYYKLMNYFEKPDQATWDQIDNLPTSEKPASEEVKAFIEKYKKNYLIQELEIASEIKYCDWGLDVSQGFAMHMPGLSEMKMFTFLLLADGAIAANQGDIPTALHKNLVVRRMGHHVTNDTLVGFLLSFAFNRKSDEALGYLLSTYLIDEKTLIKLKNELLWENYQPKSIKHPLMMEKEICLLEISKMTPQRYMKVLQGVSGNQETDKRAIEYLKNIDSASRERAAALFSKYYDDIFIIIGKPYLQAYEGIDVTSENICEDSKKNDDAILPSVFLPALVKCYNYSIRWKTEYNAMLNALDVYIAFQKEGKLPEKLSNDSYPDCFSGKPFIYETTKDGFVLRCQQEDLVDKKVQEYIYKLPK